MPLDQTHTYGQVFASSLPVFASGFRARELWCVCVCVLGSNPAQSLGSQNAGESSFRAFQA